MKKKYYIVFSILSALLIVSIITISILSAKLLKNKSEDEYYYIGNEKIATIYNITGQELKLNAYNYDSNSTTSTKYYKYTANHTLELLSQWTEYLISNKNFNNPPDLSNENDTDGSFTMTKTIDETDNNREATLDINIEYTETIIEITLIYTYIY